MLVLLPGPSERKEEVVGGVGRYKAKKKKKKTPETAWQAGSDALSPSSASSSSPLAANGRIAAAIVTAVVGLRARFLGDEGVRAAYRTCYFHFFPSLPSVDLAKWIGVRWQGT